MRLSDAIALGRTLVKAGPFCEIGTAKVGCALDMAVIACGGENWHAAKDIWPWLEKSELSPGEYNGHFWHLIDRYDREVLREKTLTLDQLIDYVRSIEPPEEAPTPVEERLVTDSVLR